MGKCKFHNDWLKEFTWLKAVEKNPHRAFCKLCNSEFGVEGHGHADLIRHENGRDHQVAVKAATGKTIKQFFRRNFEDLIVQIV